MIEIIYSSLTPTNHYNNKYKAELYIDSNKICSVEAMTLVDAFGSIIINYAQQIGISLQEIKIKELV